MFFFKLDDAPWKNEGPEEAAIRAAHYRREQFHVQLFRGGAVQLDECPSCAALVREENRIFHMSTHASSMSADTRAELSDNYPQWFE